MLALASILLAALLDSREGPFNAKATDGQRSSHEIAALLGEKGPWEDRFHAQAQDLEGKPLITILILYIYLWPIEVCHAILDLLLSAASTTTTATTSPQTPNTPASPSSYSSHHTPAYTSSAAQVPQIQPLYTSAQLTQLKIYLREQPRPCPPRDRGLIPGRDNSLFFQEPKIQNGEAEGGQSIGEGTVRFLFGPQV